MPVIFKSGVIAPLIGEATEVAEIAPSPLSSGRGLISRCLFNEFNTSSLVASATYCSTRPVNRFGSAVGGSLDRSSG